VGAVLGAFEQIGVVLLGEDCEHGVVDGGLPRRGAVRGLGWEVGRRRHLGRTGGDSGEQLLPVGVVPAALAGCSMLSPWSRSDVRCTAPQSEVTKPLNPSWPRSTPLRVASLPHE